MSNVINFEESKEAQIVEEATKQYKHQIAEEEKRSNEKHNQIKSAQEKILSLKLELITANKDTKKTITTDIKNAEIRVKQLKIEVEAINSSREYFEQELHKLTALKNKEFVSGNNEENAKKVFEELNIHFVIFDQQWYSVDAAGDRTEVKINSSDYQVIRDLIYYDSEWKINNEQELKELARGMGRIYKHIVRDFNPSIRVGIYNQMNDIRKYWLKPNVITNPTKEQQEALDAFRLIMLSVAGGNNDYADQLEKWVAYRYCHPNDVMIPNIDSCATGGTGRETLFNLCKIIFTDTCCTSAGVETFKGTHNGELFGKMIIKIDEKNSTQVPIDVLKELTGGNKYRHRSMNMDARDVERLFALLMFRNGYTTTAKLAGTGSSGEDRRWEPIIARVNLVRHAAAHFGLIADTNQILSIEDDRTVTMIIKEWQKNYFRNEEQVAIWLGHIITKHNAVNMTELLPLHGVYYHEMIQRQRKGVEGFMPKLIASMTDSNVIAIKDAHELYQVAENHKCTKDWFKEKMIYWLNTKAGWDCEEVNNQQTYPFDGAIDAHRRRKSYVQNKLALPVPRINWYLDEFINKSAENDKGQEVGDVINIWSIRDELR